MAVGVEAMFVGAVLSGEPEVGEIRLDAATASATVNGRPADLSLARYLANWLQAQLKRKGLERKWLKNAIVTIQYKQSSGKEGRSDWADFNAVAHVVSDFGETTGRFSNNQPLARGMQGHTQNPWSWFLLALAEAGILFGFVMSLLPLGPERSIALWFVMPVPILAIVGAVGWAYTEIRHLEALGPKRTSSRRILGYFGMLAAVATIAIGGALIPARLAPVIWMLFVPLWLVGGWWLHNKRRPKRRRVQRS
jgi:hypothetical protein